MKKKTDGVEKVRRLMIAVVVIAILAVVGAMVGGYFAEPERQASRKLEALAKEYYEDYYFNKLTEAGSDLSEFKETGLPSVRLRQLLLHDSESHQAEQKFFEEYECDTSATAAKFYPEKPYGREDYRVEYTLECEGF